MQKVLHLRDGVAAGKLYRACGITWGQVAAWKAASSPPKAAETEVPAVRVFDVIDEPRREATSPGCDLELRVGSWLVKVRLADDGIEGE